MNEQQKKNQTDRVWLYLLAHGTISQDEADEFKPKIKRLAARIKDLRADGKDIRTEMVSGKNEYGTYYYARYRLVV